jgi:hypothetical protein
MLASPASDLLEQLAAIGPTVVLRAAQSKREER